MSLRTSPQLQFTPACLCVMVADDHSYTRTIMGEVLRGAGVRRIVSAASGLEALEEIEAQQPDVLITDWCMDGMDGHDLARSIRASHAPSRDMPIIMMSGDTRRRQIDDAREAGVDEFIAKPVSNEKIVSRLREVCRRPRPFVESPCYIGPCRRRMKLKPKGPLRRLSDPIEALTFTAHLKQAQQHRAAACIERVNAIAQHLNPGDRIQLQAMHQGATEAEIAAIDSADLHLIRATKSLMRYLLGMGASARLQSDVIATHLEGILKIVALSGDRITERESISEGLERAVSKKLRPAEAA